MAQFYQTAEGRIDSADSFMYKPPIELMQQALDYNNQGVSTALATANLYNNLDINYIDDAREREIVDRKVSYYSNKSKEIQDEILKDPSAWQRLQPNIQALGAELQKDMTTGDIAKIQGSYNSLQKWMQDNEELRKTSPRVYQQGLNHYMTAWRNQDNRSLDGQFSAVNLVSAPDIMQDKYRKIFEGVKANAETKTGGMYKYDNKYVTEQELQEIAYGLLMSDEQFKSYARQQTTFGDSGWVDKNAEGVSTPKSMYQAYDNETGRPLTEEEVAEKKSAWNALTDEQKMQKRGNIGFTYGLNKTHEMYFPINAIAKTYSFMESKAEADEFAMIGARGVEQRKAISAQGAENRILENIKHINAKDLATHKGNIQTARDKFLFDLSIDEEYLTTDDAKVRSQIEKYKNDQAIGQFSGTLPVAKYEKGFETLKAAYESGLSPESFANFQDVQTKSLDGTTKDLNVRGFLQYYTKNNDGSKTLEQMINAYSAVDPMFKSKIEAKAYTSKTSNAFGTNSGRADLPISTQGKLNMITSFVQKNYINPYQKKLEANTSELNERTEQTTLYGINDTGSRAIKSFLNGDKDAFVVIDSNNDSQPLSSYPEIVSVKGGNVFGTRGAYVKAKFSDGTERFVMPSQGKDLNNGYSRTLTDMVAQTANNSADRAFLDKTVANQEALKLAQEFLNVKVNSEGKKVLVKDYNLNGNRVPLRMEMSGTNKQASFTITNPQTGAIIPVATIQDLAEIVGPSY